MKELFKDKVVWITGASSGLGEAMAREFFKQGAILALSARRKDRLDKICQSLKNRATSYPLDIRNFSDVKTVAEEIVKDFGKLDVVVANAGYSVVGSFLEINETMWKNLYDTNIFGTVATLKAAIPHLIKTKGRLAITSSVAGKIALAKNSVYSSSKFALVAIANSLYQELYPFNVSVTNLAPGIVESEIGKVDNWGVLHEDALDKRPKVLMYKSNSAAKEMVRAIYLRKREAVITNHGKVASFLASVVPNFTYWSLAKTGLNLRDKQQ